ncbi:MAG: DUF2442 domain-containing protein [Clostridiales bacterium]|nr:DUF2442 domain-containing protein [Clostridiales bacterium]
MLQPKLISVKPEENYMLLLVYKTSERKLFDVKPYIKGSWYGMLKDKDYFNSVRLLEDGTGIEWNDGQDIAPHELYDNSIKR